VAPLHGHGKRRAQTQERRLTGPQAHAGALEPVAPARVLSTSRVLATATDIKNSPEQYLAVKRERLPSFAYETRSLIVTSNWPFELARHRIPGAAAVALRPAR
jgi:hypothetical protein